MMEAQFLIVLIAFSFLNSFCENSLVVGDSHVEFGIFQRMLYDYDVALGPDHDCQRYVAESRHSDYEVRLFAGKNDCDGELGACTWIGIAAACASTMGREKVRWVNAWRGADHLVYGPKDDCPADEGVTQYSHRGGTTCYCDCTRSNWGVHVGLMQSRATANYVITGMRFIVHDNVLYLQPAEGKLNVDGTISNVSWISLPFKRSNIHNVRQESVNFFLDDLILDDGYHLIGIQFIYMETTTPKMVKGFGISISGQPYTDDNQLLLWPKYTLTIQPRPDTDRYDSSDISLRHKMGEYISDKSPMSYGYVKLRISNNSDFGQTTLPLFHNPSISYEVLLSGFGIFLETTNSEEKFISLRHHVVNVKHY